MRWDHLTEFDPPQMAQFSLSGDAVPDDDGTGDPAALLEQQAAAKMRRARPEKKQFTPRSSDQRRVFA